MTTHVVITCEHGGNRIPSRYRECFTGFEPLLRSHRGYDNGALRTAREMSAALGAPLIASTVSRLLIDLNRPLGHPKAFSEVTHGLPKPLREEIIAGCYLPFRAQAETAIAQAMAGGARVVHVSCHTFTPELAGKVRNADLGLLYDPARAREAALCRRWQESLRERASGLKIRMNYPYLGTADGFTVYLRRRFPADAYLGLELEINQRHVMEGGTHWRALRQAVIESFRTAAAL
ncbi:N-formylglutamate amidohydrolase [Oxalobacteraceae bacterium OM1]|nr:N-formylglutamate amidohydrolase [Oxalobacteraceae bacterium OM1]